MDKLVMAAQLLCGLSILVVVHEFGHYLAARIFGIKVEKFFLFFDAGGVKLFSFKKGDTEYGVGWLPLGGYVKIKGMIDESMDKEFKSRPPEPDEFRSKPAWQRLIVMVGGITMNVILGILIFTFHTWHYGEKYIPATELKNGIVAQSLGKQVGFQTGDIILSINGKKPEKLMDVYDSDIILDEDSHYEVLRDGKKVDIKLPRNFGRKAITVGLDSFITFRQEYAVDSVMKDSNAYIAGLMKRDSILTINGSSAIYYDDATSILKQNKNKTVDLAVLRYKNGQKDTVHLNVKVTAEGTIGFVTAYKTKQVDYSLGESFVIGAHKAWKAVFDTFRGLWRLVKGDLPPKKSLHGLIGIATYYGGQWDWFSFWSLTGVLSMVLAFMNLLPIPALDGGHVIFLLVEMVRRKPISYRFLEVAQMVGMVILFLLMGFAIYNDITEYVIK
jgi:regulator of sigma E protease